MKRKNAKQKVDQKVITDMVQSFYSVEPEKVEPIILDFGMTKLGTFETLFRSPFGGDGDRFYFNTKSPEFFTGYSTWTKSVLRQSKALRTWEMSVGADRAELIGTAAREYGSLLHLVIAMHEKVDNPVKFRFNDTWWRDMAIEVAKANILPVTVVETWCKQLQNDMASYFTWKRNHKVKVLAVEVPLMNYDFMVATPGDMVVEMEISMNEAKGKKKFVKRVVAGIDFKSGDKSASYDNYRLQLEFVRYQWNQMFKGTEYEMTHIFNWRPSPRATRPGGFILTDQSGYFTEEQLIHLGRTNRIMKYNVPSGGVVEYYDSPDAEEYISESLSPLKWLEKWQNDFRI